MCWVVKCLQLGLTIDWLGGQVSKLYCDSSQVRVGLADCDSVNILMSEIDWHPVANVLNEESISIHKL